MTRFQQTHLQTTASNPVPFATNAPRNRAAAFIDWCLGVHPSDEEGALVATREPEIEVVAPSEHNSWVDSFHVALTEAATSFICQYVDPYHRVDPSAGFAVTRVKVGFKDASARCLRAIQSMPAAMRDRIVLLRIKKAKGADQLMLDRFYGMSMVAEETLLGDQLVETMVNYSNSRFVLRFEFEGFYCELPQAPEQVAATPEATPKPGNTAQESLAPKDEISASKAQETAFDKRSGQQPHSATPRVGRDTPMYQRPTGTPMSSSRETPLYQPLRPVRTPVVRLQLAVQDSKTMVELYPDDFPCSIGRHPQAPGFAVRPRSGALSGSVDVGLLAHTQTPESICYVSRDHLILKAPDLLSGEICIDNLAATPKKNGTFINGVAQPERFIHVLGAKHSLCLGGPAGDGILEMRMELA